MGCSVAFLFVVLCAGCGLLGPPAWAGSGVEFERTGPARGDFSVEVPAGWARSVFDRLAVHRRYELILYAPGSEGLAYALMGVIYVADPHRSAERYIFDQRHPRFPRVDFASGEVGEGRDDPTLGPGAKRLEIETDRQPPLGVSGDPITVVRRQVIRPLDPGYVAFVLDAPPPLVDGLQALFEHLVGSFQQRDGLSESVLPEVTGEEYRVYTGLAEGWEVGMDSGIPSTVVPLELCAAVAGETDPAEAINGDDLQQAEQIFGPLDPTLVADFRARNTHPYLIRDRILVAGLHVVAADRPAARTSYFTDTPLPAPGLLGGCVMHLSRVGFAAGGNLALVHVQVVGGGPGSGHLVLLRRVNERWVVIGTVMTEYKIY